MQKYCLDTNFFIEAWNKYYSPEFCFGYWEIIEKLGREDIVFVPEMVKTEIDKYDDNLKKWFHDKSFLIKEINTSVQDCLKKIYAADKNHQRLVDSTKGRSAADPWVIAHAFSEGATVVTKEFKESNPDTARIKIPNVCENMGIKCIDDFEFIKELKITFVSNH